jgi:hypothetical protein
MHILGKILAWTVLLGAISGIVLMSRQLQVKNSYTKKLRDLKKQNAADANSIEQKEAELAKLDAEFQREMHGQLAYWDKRSGIPNAATGSIGMGVGLQDGIGIVATNAQAAGQTAKRRTRLYVYYQPQANNPQTVYIGPFDLSDKQTEVARTSARLYPDWKLRPGEVPTDNVGSWPNGLNLYRVRATAPTRYTTVFRDLYLQLESEARDIVAAGAEKKRAEDQLKTAEAEVTKYRVIIAGKDGTGGMLAELSKAEDERDAVLGIVDRLRRMLKVVVDTRTDLIKKNKELVPKLSPPTSQSGKP